MAVRLSDDVLLEKILSLLTPSQIETLLYAMGHNSDYGQSLKCKLDEINAAVLRDGDFKQLAQRIKDELDNSSKLPEDFFPVLCKFIDRENKKDSEIYHAIGMHRNTWSRLKKNGVQTDNRFILKLCVILKLDHYEAYYLMALAGYSFNPSSITDQVVIKCIQNKFYNQQGIDELLCDKEQPVLFGEE